MTDATRARLKVVALACLALPMLVLAVLAIGEVAGGTLSGLQHIPQLLLLAGLGWLGWRRPWLGGPGLIVLSLVLAGLSMGMTDFPPATRLVSIVLLLAPPLLAGILFVAASRRQHPTHVGGQGVM